MRTLSTTTKVILIVATALTCYAGLFWVIEAEQRRWAAGEIAAAVDESDTTRTLRAGDTLSYRDLTLRPQGSFIEDHYGKYHPSVKVIEVDKTDITMLVRLTWLGVSTEHRTGVSRNWNTWVPKRKGAAAIGVGGASSEFRRRPPIGGRRVGHPGLKT